MELTSAFRVFKFLSKHGKSAKNLTVIFVLSARYKPIVRKITMTIPSKSESSSPQRSLQSFKRINKLYLKNPGDLLKHDASLSLTIWPKVFHAVKASPTSVVRVYTTPKKIIIIKIDAKKAPIVRDFSNGNASPKNIIILRVLIADKISKTFIDSTQCVFIFKPAILIIWPIREKST